MDDDRYTRITLRIPKELHSQLQEASDASSKSINAEIIGRVQQSFEPNDDVLTTGVMARLDYQLADTEQELASTKMRLAELALALKMAIYNIPDEARKADHELDRQIKEWIVDSEECLAPPTDLIREAEQKTQRLMMASHRLEEVAKFMKNRNDAVKKP